LLPIQNPKHLSYKFQEDHGQLLMMGFCALFWCLITLFGISLTNNHPQWALGIGMLGGLILGISFWWQTGMQLVSSFVSAQPFNLSSWLCRYELLFFWPPFGLLFFANHFSLVSSLVAFFILVFFRLNWMIRTGDFPSLTPLHFPIFLLFLSSLFSLFSTVDLHQSVNAIFILSAGIMFFDWLIRVLDTHIYIMFGIFLAASIGIALTTPLFMQLPQEKLPIVPELYNYFPSFSLNRIHPNYIAGSLIFPFLLSFGILMFRHKYWVWACVAVSVIGFGILMTQSRGAMFSSGIGMVLIGAYYKRWVRQWGIILILLGSLIAYWLGLGSFFSAETRKEFEFNIETRKELWQRAVFISQDFPFTGIGMRSFPVVVDLLYPLSISGPNSRQPHAHNLFLEIVVAIGYPGFVAFWILLGTWVGMIWEIIAVSRRSPGKRYCEVCVVGLSGGMVAHLLYSIADAIALGEKAGIVFWAVLGFTAVLWRQVREKDWL
jgi:hypothetical protein